MDGYTLTDLFSCGWCMYFNTVVEANHGSMNASSNGKMRGFPNFSHYRHGVHTPMMDHRCILHDIVNNDNVHDMYRLSIPVDV